MDAAPAAAEQSRLIAAAEQFLATAKSFDGNPNSRQVLTRQADALRLLAEDGFGAIDRVTHMIHVKTALRVLTLMGVWNAIPKEGGGGIGSKQLADAVNLDESVIQRSMRLAVAQGIGEETMPDHYAHNTKSLAFCSGDSQYLWKSIVDQDEALMTFTKYLQSHSREDLYDLKKSPYAWSHGMEGKTYYEAISAQPQVFDYFNRTLAFMDQVLPVLGMYPFASVKAQVEAEPHRPFVVDIGGGFGKVLMSIQKEAPAGFGAKCILQDRPDVLASIPEGSLPNVTLMEHDFFTPQPVKNAHLYFFRRILHDFYDPVCVELVKNVASAMGPTSRLLIGDYVVPEHTKAGDDGTLLWLDFSMMMIGGKEKTAKQFANILDAAGLELVKIWPFPYGPQAVVEAKLKS